MFVFGWAVIKAETQITTGRELIINNVSQLIKGGAGSSGHQFGNFDGTTQFVQDLSRIGRFGG